MNRSTPDAAVTFDPTHNTYATLGELHLDRERDLHLVRDVRCGGRGAGAPRSRRSRAPATWNDGVDGALLCGLLFSLHDDQVNQAHGVLQVLAVLLTGYTPASAAESQAVSDTDCSTAGASTFSLLLLYVVKLYDISVHLDLCARAPQLLWSLLTFSKPACALGFIDTAGASG